MRVESHVPSSGSGDHAANHLSPAPVLQVAALPSPALAPSTTLTGPPADFGSSSGDFVCTVRKLIWFYVQCCVLLMCVNVLVFVFVVFF